RFGGDRAPGELGAHGVKVIGVTEQLDYFGGLLRKAAVVQGDVLTEKEVEELVLPGGGKFVLARLLAVLFGNFNGFLAQKVVEALVVGGEVYDGKGLAELHLDGENASHELEVLLQKRVVEEFENVIHSIG